MKTSLIAFLLAAVIVCGCSGNGGGGKASEPITVRVTEVTYTEDFSKASLVGTVRPSKSAVITGTYPGRVVRVCVKEGQKLSAGSVIAVIDAQTVKSSYEAAKAVYEQAQDALARAEKVYGDGGISKLKMVDIRTSCTKAKAAYDAAAKSLEDCTLRAPYAGVVGEVFAIEGSELQPGAPVIKMLDVGRVEVHASVPENEYVNYSVGMPVYIEIPATGAVFGGVLAFKGLEASRITCSYDCTFAFSSSCNTDGVMPGMLCKVHVKSGNDRSIVIPSSSVMVDEDGRYVWCCNSGTVSRRRVVIDGFSGKGVIISSGLEAGDMLVVEGCGKISDGMTGIRTVE